MRKFAFLLTLVMGFISLQAQEYHIQLHHSGQVMYQNKVTEIENLYIQGSAPSTLLINTSSGPNSFLLSAFDSITFVLQEPPQPGDAVTITYYGNTATVVNPYTGQGIEVTTNGADVTVNSTLSDVSYLITGNTPNGSLTINSNSAYTLTLSDLNITSTTTSAINLASPVNVMLTVEGTCVLADGAYSAINGALYAAGNLIVEGDGILQVTGNAKHGILVDGDLTVNSGEIDILDTDSDGIHGNGNLSWNGGRLLIASAGTDGLDISGDILIQSGDLEVSTNAESARSIKVSGIFNMADGHLTVNTTGADGKGLKCDSTLLLVGGVVEVNVSGQGANGISSDQHISVEGAEVTIVSSAYDGKCFKSDNTFSMSDGSINLTHSGDLSKGIKTVGDITINGGDITINASGSTVLEVENNQNVPAYCTAIKCDADIHINGGTFHITLPTSNHGGKGISADGSISISGGDFTIETHGNGASYTVSGSTKDAYTSSCLKCDGDMIITAGTLNLTSTGTGGKGINVGTTQGIGKLTLGAIDGDDSSLILNVSTSGERITVTAGGGGPWGGGDYANPKAIKSMGDLTINSGTIRVNCTQNNEGGEGIESKSVLTINGGDIEVYSKSDDPVNARSNLTFNGGVYYAHSDVNDGSDSNGTMVINGGFLISNGARQPEEGFDCDNNQFRITGGTAIGTGGGTSNPTSSVCTQPTLKINTQSGYAIQILKSDGTVICTYQCPTISGGGGWPGGGGNGLTMLFTDPQLQTGQSYIVKYNGTISGGTAWHGYYTGNVTYTGGSTTNVNVNSMYTTVSAGGGGW